MKNICIYDIENLCCGCMACYNACPVQAISVSDNEKGFYVPQIDDKKCVGCGLCLRVCQIGNAPMGASPIEKHGVVACDESVRMQSSSGGLFWSLISEMFATHGERFHCFGVELDRELQTVYSQGDSLEQCVKFRGSKYVQSYVGDTFSHIANLLKQGDVVMFVGTGCQCAGLKKYIEVVGVDDCNLWVVDIVCHGTPSHRMFRDYLKSVEDRAGKKIKTYRFRNKEAGWRGQHPIAHFEDGSEVQGDKLFMSYGRLFGNLSLNTPCHTCKYANVKRIGDLTMGDFWGVEKTSCQLDDGKGVSLCLVNTEKGKCLFDLVRPNVQTYRIEDDSYLQPQLCAPTKANILREDFWKDYLKRGYGYVATKYAGHGKIYRAMMKAVALVKQKVKRLL